MSRNPANPGLRFYWLHSQPVGEAFHSSQRSGSWCLELTARTVDTAWARIDALVVAGLLPAATASTLWGSRQLRLSCLLIFVRTADWRDRDEVGRVRQILYESGFGITRGYVRDIYLANGYGNSPRTYADADFPALGAGTNQ